MRQKLIAFLLLGLCAFLLAVTVIIGVWRFGGIERMEETASPAGDLTYEMDPQGEPVKELAKEPAIPEERVMPERDSAVIPAQDISVDEDYFADAAFLVNSVSQGLDMYDYDELLSRADFYGEEELSAFDGVDYIRDMKDGDYGKIYIGLGINELWRDMDAIRACYGEMLEELMSYSEDSIIVLMGVPPVSAYKSSTNASYTRELVVEYNEMLLELAEEWGVWYLDVYAVLADGDGYLPSEVTMDGLHFTPAYYKNWFQLLSSHYVDDGSMEILPALAAEESPVPLE